MLLAFFLSGLAALYYGVGGVLRGHITITVRNAEAVVLTASDGLVFIGYTGLCIVAGLALVGCSAVLGCRLVFGDPSRQEEVLRAVDKSIRR